MIFRLFRIYRILIQRFGFTLRPIGTFFLILLYRLFSFVTSLSDWLFFPRLWKTEVKAPVFIVGNPRSGTTFLHRFMVDQGIGVGHQLWQLLWPSLTARTAIRPIVGMLERFSPARFHGTKAHPTSLTSVETDDVVVFFRYVDGLFAWGYAWAWDDDPHLEELDLDGRLGATAPRDFGYLRDCLRRNLAWYRHERVIGKLFSMALRPELSFRHFPDMKMIYMLRDPVEVIPSGMNLMTEVLEAGFNMKNVDPAWRKTYYERLYRASCLLYRRFHDAWKEGRIPREQVYICSYPRMMREFEVVMAEIDTFIGYTPTAEVAAAIEKTAAKQRTYKSEHKYDLERFNLSAEQIRADLAFVYETWPELKKA